MTQEELVELVKEIINVKGKTEEEIDDLIDILIKNVPHSEVTDLIYWTDLTPEEVVDKALSYKPIAI
jgi:hypothetical protein